MRVFLLDVNVLIALAWPEHSAHDVVGRWFERRARAWATCPFTQAALVRILSNHAFSPNALTPTDAVAVLEKNIGLPGHHFWPDSLSFPDALALSQHRILGHRQVTDSYLLGLAIHRRGKLATLDRKILSMGAEEAVEIID